MPTALQPALPAAQPPAPTCPNQAGVRVVPPPVAKDAEAAALALAQAAQVRVQQPVREVAATIALARVKAVAPQDV